MLRIRNPFYYTQNKWADVNCYHCGKYITILVPNLRAYNYCGECKRPYIDFCIECGLEAQKTPDGVAWIDPTIDLPALDAVMSRLAPEKEKE